MDCLIRVLYTCTCLYTFRGEGEDFCAIINHIKHHSFKLHSKQHFFFFPIAELEYIIFIGSYCFILYCMYKEGSVK